jgi:putative flavoprotein involved in K+ transport
MERTDLVIIGAGQAGLATAFAARRHGLHPVVLEASNLPAGSWPTYYESLRLFSPARFSSLPERPFPGDPDRYPTRDEVVAYLVDYADWLGADIRLGERARSVRLEQGALVVETERRRSLHAPRVVVATGGFGSPHRPALPGLADFAGGVLHSSEYRSPERFRDQRVLVVGGGNSAVQIGAELATVARVTLTTRSRLRWVPQRPLGRDVHWWLTRSGVDGLPVGSFVSRRTLPVLDDGRYRAAVAAGRPDHRQMFRAVDRGEVVWSDGEREPVDTIVLATGYRSDVRFLAGTGALDPTGEPLQRRGISSTVPGLGYVGLENQRTVASATIRSVGRDARHLLRHLRPAGVTRAAGDAAS